MFSLCITDIKTEPGLKHDYTQHSSRLPHLENRSHRATRNRPQHRLIALPGHQRSLSVSLCVGVEVGCGNAGGKFQPFQNRHL